MFQVFKVDYPNSTKICGRYTPEILHRYQKLPCSNGNTCSKAHHSGWLQPFVFEGVYHSVLVPKDYILGCPPAQSIFSRGSRTKLSFATVARRGDSPNYIFQNLSFFWIKHKHFSWDYKNPFSRNVGPGVICRKKKWTSKRYWLMLLSIICFEKLLLIQMVSSSKTKSYVVSHIRLNPKVRLD